MGEDKAGETKVREQQELAAEAARIKRSSNHLVWKIVGGTALALIAAGVIHSLHDIRRYIRIVRM